MTFIAKRFNQYIGNQTYFAQRTKISKLHVNFSYFETLFATRNNENFSIFQLYN